MTPEERALIDGLFERMRAVENQPRDAEAEALIAQYVAQAPHAPYALAQTVLVQEHALQQAYARVQELEAEVREHEAQAAQQSQGGFLGGLFGGGRSSVPSAGSRNPSAIPTRNLPPGMPNGAPNGAPMGVPPGYAQAGGPPPSYGQAAGPWGAQPQRGGFGGGGFLQGALATAAGVAGGALLYDGIKNMMAGGGGPIGQAVASELPQSSGSGNLGQDAQAALGGAPDAGQDGGQGGGDTAGWDDDSQTAEYDDGGYDDAGYDDGGGFDAGGDDWT